MTVELISIPQSQYDQIMELAQRQIKHEFDIEIPVFRHNHIKLAEDLGMSLEFIEQLKKDASL